MRTASKPDRLVVGLTGATGQVFGIRALELLTESDCESHLILTDAAKMNVQSETDYDVAAVERLATEVYDVKNIGATVASGSFDTEGMIVAPCSMKSLSDIATGSSDNLLTRAADVVLKERRPLVLMPREKPLSHIHLQNMLTVTRAGGIIVPPFLSFYRADDSLNEMITRTVARALEQCNVRVEYEEWKGVSGQTPPKSDGDGT